ncbi:MAG TPA: DUF4382 domain-containing protein [Moraxellaceae bacterium]|nr:DUF4382 domain-containing protein [Moraxellaceae bacterium]
MKRYPLLACLALGGGLLLGGCNSDTPAGRGTLNVALTDAPGCGYDHVYVTVERVRVHRSDNAGAQDGGWHEVVLEAPRKIDLLTLSNGVMTTLGQTGLPAGHYQQIRLVLAPNTGNVLSNSLVPTGGTEEALATPSATQSGYKVIGDFRVAADAVVDLVLDFDACRSIVAKGNGGYALKPVVTATVQAVSGSIVGHVDVADAGATVYAQQAGRILKGTLADASGRFVLAPVIQSSSNGSYDVVITRGGDTATIVRGVPVVAGAATTISTSAAPFVLADAAPRTAGGTVTPASASAVVEALQAVAGGNYVIASTNAALDTGDYMLALPAGAPLVGDYAGILPVGLAPEATAAGRYNVRATTTAGTSQTQDVDVQAASAAGIDFLF